jgi:hypothetical protein
MNAGRVSAIMAGNLPVLAELDPFRASREAEAVERFRGEDGWGPRRPKRKLGDAWVMIGALAGIIAGGILGYQVGIVTAFLGIIAGGIVGALLGSLVRAVVRRRAKERIVERHRTHRRG